MDIRIGFSFIFSMLSAALIVCAVLSAKSSKAIGKAVAILDLSFIPPIIGNVIIIGSHVETISKVGYYLYFIGMDVVIYALLHFRQYRTTPVRQMRSQIFRQIA